MPVKHALARRKTRAPHATARAHQHPHTRTGGHQLTPHTACARRAQPRRAALTDAFTANGRIRPSTVHGVREPRADVRSLDVLDPLPAVTPPPSPRLGSGAMSAVGRTYDMHNARMLPTVTNPAESLSIHPRANHRCAHAPPHTHTHTHTRARAHTRTHNRMDKNLQVKPKATSASVAAAAAQQASGKGEDCNGRPYPSNDGCNGQIYLQRLSLIRRAPGDGAIRRRRAGDDPDGCVAAGARARTSVCAC